MGRTVTKLLIVPAVAAAMAACNATEPAAKTETQTVTVSAAPPVSAEPSAPPPVSAQPALPSAASPAEGPHSKLIDVTLPAGSTTPSGVDPTLELWTVTTPYHDTVQFLRQQLPIFHDYHGLPWCSQDINGILGITEWDWADTSGNTLAIAVDKRGTVSITTTPDPISGRKGCD